MSASYFAFAPDLPLNVLPIAQRIKGGVRIRLKTTAGVKFSQMSIDRLCFYLAGRDDVANKLYELCLAAGLGTLALPPRARAVARVSAGGVHPAGRLYRRRGAVAGDLALVSGLPVAAGIFSVSSAVSLFRADGTRAGPQTGRSEQVELVILLGRGEPTLESVVDGSNLALFCTPAINLFPKRADRIHVSDSAHEYHVVADRTRPLDFEIYEVTSVVGHGIGTDSEQQFLPFYSAYSSDQEHQQSAYYTTRREPRLVSRDREAPRIPFELHRDEVFLALVDSAQAPFSGDLRQLSIQTLCTNRDLVLQMPTGVGTERLDAGHRRSGGEHSRDERSEPSVRAAGRRRRVLARDQPSVAQLSVARAIDAEEGADCAARPARAVRGERGRERQEADRGHPVGAGGTRRPPVASAGPLAFGRGLEIAVQVDELAFEGASAFLLGSVLDRILHATFRSTRLPRRCCDPEPRRDQPMGATMGRETDAVAFFAALAKAPYRHDFYQTLRRLECLYGTSRVGKALRPVDEPVRLGQDPDLSFAPAPLASFEIGRRHAAAAPGAPVRLFGPNGPLPIHLTEYARERLRQARSDAEPLSRPVSPPVLALFYRAWAKAQPP